MPVLIEESTLREYLQPVKAPGDARQDAVEWAPNLTITKGTVVGVIAASKKAAPYAPAAGDGTETAVGLAMYSFKTDADGKVYYVAGATPAGASRRAGPHMTSPIWVSGTFDPRELTGWDSAAQADLNARVMHDGFIQIP